MLLTEYKWYRKLCGGVWYLTTPGHLCPYVTGSFWSKKYLGCETIIKKENYMSVAELVKKKQKDKEDRILKEEIAKRKKMDLEYERSIDSFIKNFSITKGTSEESVANLIFNKTVLTFPFPIQWISDCDGGKYACMPNRVFDHFQSIGKYFGVKIKTKFNTGIEIKGEMRIEKVKYIFVWIELK